MGMGQVRDPRPACRVCRLKKRKCDRGSPVCGGCIGRGLTDECSYNPEDMPTRSRRRKEIGSGLPTPLVVINTPTRAQYLDDFDEGSEVDAEGSEHPEEQDLHDESNMSDQTFDTAVDMHIRSPSLEINETPNLNLKALQMVVNRRTGCVKDEVDMSTVQPRTNGLNPEHVGNVELSMNPSKDLADRLVDTYLTREYVNLPIFDLAEFKAAYETTSNDNVATGSSVFHGILNVIFALSSLRIYTVTDAETASFFARGQKLTNMFSDHERPWELIQSCILQSQYLTATGNPRRAWAVIGFTICTAQSFGLHSKTGAQDARSRRQRELSRKLWHSAVIMERILALQLGTMPRTSNVSRVPLPTHLDSDYVDAISGKISSSGDRPSIIEFLTAYAKLYSNVEETMKVENEFRTRSNCTMKKLMALDMKPLLKVDGLLYDWKMSLPSFLRMDGSEDIEDPIVLRQRNILRARYLYIRLRLYRPLLILGVALSSPCSCRGGSAHITEEAFASDSPIALSLVRDSSVKCVMTAMELADLLKNRAHAAEENLMPEWWENIGYLYASWTVVLSAKICPALFSGTPVDGDIKTKLNENIQKTSELLKEYEKARGNNGASKMARRCVWTVKYLEIISDRIASHDDMDESMMSRLPHIGMETPRRRSQGKRRRSDTSCFALGDTDTDTDQGNSQLIRRFLCAIESLPVDLED